MNLYTDEGARPPWEPSSFPQDVIDGANRATPELLDNTAADREAQMRHDAFLESQIDPAEEYWAEDTKQQAEAARRQQVVSDNQLRKLELRQRDRGRLMHHGMYR